MKHLYKTSNDHRELVLYPESLSEHVALALISSVHGTEFGTDILLTYRAIISTKQANIHEVSQFGYPVGFAVERWGKCSKFQQLKLKIASKLLGTKLVNDLITINTRKVLS